MNQATVEPAFHSLLEQLGVGDVARLVTVSPFDPGRRVYWGAGRVFKVVLASHECTAQYRAQDLAGEFSMLKALAGCPGIPQEAELSEFSTGRVLSYRHMAGAPLAEVTVSLRKLGRILGDLGKVLYRVSRRGICHNDIRSCNVLVTTRFRTFLIDFDQATLAPAARAFASNFLGWNPAAKSHGSYLGLAWELVRRSTPIPIKRAYRLLRRLGSRPSGQSPHQRLKPLPRSASWRLRQLHAAWKIAQRSEANSPGGCVCYYSLDLDDFHLPGERPWAERWSVLRHVTPVDGRRILELGCNLGLLSCHMLSEGGAAAALCVDRDEEILEAARRVSAAYGVTPRYLQVDFDSPANWEEQLARFRPDMVVALSVLNWVRDKERFLAFLGRFDEVLFEGHDAIDVERDRLVRHGFSEVRLVAVSERDRAILHGRKALSHPAPGVGHG